MLAPIAMQTQAVARAHFELVYALALRPGDQDGAAAQARAYHAHALLGKLARHGRMPLARDLIVYALA